jgi:hypothetical protein
MHYTLPTLPTASAGATITLPDVATLTKPPNTAIPGVVATLSATLNSFAGSLPNPKLPSGFKNPFSGLQGAASIFGKTKVNTMNMQAAGAWAPPLTVMSPSIPSSAYILSPVSSQGARGSL